MKKELHKAKTTHLKSVIRNIKNKQPEMTRLTPMTTKTG